MHLITQICVLLLWIHAVTFVTSKDCTLEEFINNRRLYDSNFDTTNLEQSYSPGKQVRVTCSVGFTGSFKLICTDRGWESRGSKCQAQQCPLIHVESNVQVIGDLEEANYGNVMQFSCKSRTEILDGPTEIYCNANGEWSAEPPTCKEITCSVPVIENGDVIDVRNVYRENEVLEFSCNRKYKRSNDIPSKCTKLGSKSVWSPTPGCDPIRCKVDRLEGTTHDPPYKNLFLIGETVTVICAEKYWIFRPQETRTVSTCQDNGQWDIRPICQEVTCRNQKQPNMYYWELRWWDRPTLDDTVRFTCSRGYKRAGGATSVTCTRDEWKPNPACEDISELLGCETPPILDNGDIKYTVQSQYNHSDKVEYMCALYHTMEGEPYRTCINGEWTGHMRCLEPCILNEDDNRQHNITLKSSDKKYFLHDEIMEFECARGVPVGNVAMRSRCNGGVVPLPTCQ